MSTSTTLLTTADLQARDPAHARELYREHGLVIVPRLLSDDLLKRGNEHIDGVLRGEYETGRAPYTYGHVPGIEMLKQGRLVKIDQPQYADRTVLEIISQPVLGEYAAAITGASMVQVWAVQLLVKPPSPAKEGANVGWHQDNQYWHTWWTPESEIFTMWLAMSEVPEDCGPMKMVPGSHHWGFLNQGDFFGQNQQELREQIKVPQGQHWHEISASMGIGQASFHHKFTFHGSGPNRSNQERRSFAIHMRTQNSQILPGDTNYAKELPLQHISPVIYGKL